MKRTTRSVMREILGEHPKGLGALKLKELVLQRHAAASADSIPVMLCVMRDLGQVMRTPARKCECCGRQVTTYKLTKRDFE